MIARVSRYFRVGYVMHALRWESDFLGVNYYLSNGICWNASGDPHYVTQKNDYSDPDIWQKYAAGFGRVLDEVDKISRKQRKPIYVLENGKPSDFGHDDVDRQDFLSQHISIMCSKIDCGSDIRGYFHYCLMDSYEWEQGYTMRFGLMSIDRDKQLVERRGSFDLYATIIGDDYASGNYKLIRNHEG